MNIPLIRSSFPVPSIFNVYSFRIKWIYRVKSAACLCQVQLLSGLLRDRAFICEPNFPRGKLLLKILSQCPPWKSLCKIIENQNHLSDLRKKSCHTDCVSHVSLAILSFFRFHFFHSIKLIGFTFRCSHSYVFIRRQSIEERMNALIWICKTVTLWLEMIWK